MSLPTRVSILAMGQLTFVDFMEALARLANAMPIPSDQDMKDAEVSWRKSVSRVAGDYRNSMLLLERVAGYLLFDFDECKRDTIFDF